MRVVELRKRAYSRFMLKSRGWKRPCVGSMSFAKMIKTDPMEILNQERRLAELQQTARELDPDFAQLHDRVRELEQQEEAVNRMRILKADRADYDREHPPLELLKLENCTRDEFALDSPLLLWLLRRELGRFLRIRGEAVFHPSDLTRDDFRSDFTKNKYLDDPQR